MKRKRKRRRGGSEEGEGIKLAFHELLFINTVTMLFVELTIFLLCFSGIYEYSSISKLSTEISTILN